MSIKQGYCTILNPSPHGRLGPRHSAGFVASSNCSYRGLVRGNVILEMQVSSFGTSIASGPTWAA